MFEKIYEYVKIYIEPDWTQKFILRINTQVVITAKRTPPPPLKLMNFTGLFSYTLNKSWRTTYRNIYLSRRSLQLSCKIVLLV